MGLIIIIMGIAVIWFIVRENREKKGLLKSCKACNREIGINVNICPHCGTKQKNSVAKWVVTFFVLLFLINFCNGFINRFPKALEKVKAERGDVEKIYSLKEDIQIEKFKISVVSAEEKGKVGNSFISSVPADGGTYVAVIWTYKNISDKPIKSFDFPTLKLIDDKGTEYSSDLNATANFSTEIKKDAKVFSDLNPDISVTDAQVFEVSKEKFNSSTWKILIETDEKIKVNIKN